MESRKSLDLDIQRINLMESNNTNTNPFQADCIHKLFEEQVERSPNQIAVICENQQLTYKELNTRANQLAHHLQTLGVAPDVLVGLYMERSISIFYRSYLRYIKHSDADLRLLDLNIVNTHASETYLAQVYTGRVTLFRCKPLDSNTDFGWAKLTTGGVDITIVPGNHANIMEDPNVIVSAKQLNLCLQQIHRERADKIKTSTKIIQNT